MRRYRFLDEKEVYKALNKLRDAFLAAKNGEEVEEIINGILTFDEKLKIGRRILIANQLLSGFKIDEISRILKVGKNTIMHVSRRLEKYNDCFILIEKRSRKVKKEFNNKRYRRVGGSTLLFKKKKYTGFKRKNVER